MGYVSFSPTCSVISPSFPNWVGEPDHWCLPGLVPRRLNCPNERQMSHKYNFEHFSPHESSSKSNIPSFSSPFPFPHLGTAPQAFCNLPLEIQGNIYRGFCVLNFSFSPEFLLQLLRTFLTWSTFHQADFRKSREPKLFQKELLSTPVSALLVMTKCRYKCTKNC